MEYNWIQMILYVFSFIHQTESKIETVYPPIISRVKQNPWDPIVLNLPGSRRYRHPQVFHAVKGVSNARTGNAKREFKRGYCDEDEVQCLSREQCIRQKTICDGNTNCVDQSDEWDCGRCEENTFQCYNGVCLLEVYRCDGNLNCYPQGEDEHNCSGPCLPSQFVCDDGTCIKGDRFCDVFIDCPDQSDESNCPCSLSEYKCTDGSCIPDVWECDVWVDCLDKSDESHCHACSSGGVVKPKQLCDHMWDCSDGSDEAECPPLTVGDEIRITSMYYPITYKNNKDYIWTYNTHEGYLISIHLNRVDIEDDHDYIEIGNGNRPFNVETRLAKITGNRSCDITSTGHMMWVWFYTDWTVVSSGFEGFVTVRKAVDPLNYPDICGLNSDNGARIVNGNDARIAQFPWQALIFRKYESSLAFTCGGVLISTKHVLTSAHCFNGEGMEHPENWYIKLGTISMQDQEVGEHGSDVTAIIIHPNFNSYTYDNDIALIVIADDAPLISSQEDLSITQPINVPCMDNVTNKWNSDSSCFISGYGVTGDGDMPSVLQHASVTYLNSDQCLERSLYGNDEITENMICAGSLGDDLQEITDACWGDSGSPLVCKQASRYVLVGIASWGRGCGVVGFPGVYTKIINFLTWIADEQSKIV